MSQAKPVIRVVAALIEKEGRYLITQRRPEASLPLLWEFPGGRVEETESDQEALVRELAEEMHVTLTVQDKLFEVEREYERYIIHFATYACSLQNPEIKPIKVHQYRFVTRDELGEYEFPGADQQTIDLLLSDR